MHSHVRVLGRYHFALDESVVEGGMRPLRDPKATEDFGLNAGFQRPSWPRPSAVATKLRYYYKTTMLGS
jgi:hypothetical protein